MTLDCYALTQTVAPTIEPVTAQDVFTVGRVPDENESQVALNYCKAARGLVEKYTGRQLITATWELKLHRFPGWEIDLPRGPGWAITSIAYLDETGASQTVSASNYRLGSRTGILTPADNTSWPTTYDVSEAVTITYTSGYGANAASVPQEIKEAIKATVIDWMENRRMVFDLPPAVKRILDAFWDGRL